MSIYSKRNIVVLVVAIGFLAAGPVLGGSVATFADPTVVDSTPLFTLSDTELTGGWNAGGLKLIVALTGEEFEDATFTMTDLTVTGGALSGGTISFYESAAEGGALILQIDFDGGLLDDGHGFIGDQTTTFSGPVITQDMTNAYFSFVFANSVEAGNTTTYTAAFNSSADLDENDDGDAGDGNDDGDDSVDDDSDDDGGNSGSDSGDDADDSSNDDDNSSSDNNTGNAGNSSDELEAVAEQLGCGQLCGAGMLPVMPMMLLGLGIMKYRHNLVK